MKNFIIIALLFSFQTSFSQKNEALDSLLKNYYNAKIDTAKFTAAKKLFNYYNAENKYADADTYSKICSEIASNSKNPTLKVTSKKIEALLASDIGNYGKALELYQTAIDLINKTSNSIQLDEIAGLKNSMGRIYFILDKKDDALKYFKESYELEKDQIKKENCLLNIGVAHAVKQEYDKAETYFIQVKTAYEKRNDSMSIAYVLNNIGLLNVEQGKFDKGLKYLEASYQIKMRKGDIKEKISAHFILADFYVNRRNFAKSKYYIDEETKLLDTTIRNTVLLSYYALLQKYNEGTGKYNAAYQYLKKFNLLNSELQDEEKLNEIKRTALQNEYSIKLIGDSIKNQNINQMNQLKIAEQTANLNKEKILRYALIIGLLMLGAMGYFIFKRFKESKAKNLIIEKQNLELAKKNKETEDSLIYASRLQNGILPKIQELKKDFQDAFILYQPKDIVSGDFYWTYKEGNIIYIAVGDCTGHGVPGAMMSFLSFNNLERCVKELKLTSTAQILEKLSGLIEQSFAFEEKAIRDGLDISLIKIDLESKELTFSGANNNLYLIQHHKIQKVKATRRSIGYSEFKHPFLEMAFTLHSNDQLFLITDGYADQIGGEKSKKFLTKNLENQFIKIQLDTAENQKAILQSELNNWMQEHEQIDDVTILGLKIA
jgi:serine phosphatase RsbU (regulator of sigma subunit)